jgi:D-glycero-alpha-D-manno-heptose-7-phosphate kinase
MNENWSSQKALHPTISSPHLDSLMNLAMRNGAIGGKACGAGGGGCLLFLAGEGQAPALRRALAERGLQNIDVEFDTYGVHLTRA